MMNPSPEPSSCEVIVLTALPVEFEAVMRHVQDAQEYTHSSGTIYQQGIFVGVHRTWHVAVAEIGMGGIVAAVEAEKAIQFFHPQIACFVGVAGGLKDVRRGDVVVATKVYAYEAGKAGSRFEPRPDLGHSSYALEQRARAEAHGTEWLARLEGGYLDPAPRVVIGAIAAGEKVLSSKQSSLARLLKRTYGDALAIEMEGHGFLHAVLLNHTVLGLVVRGISDLVDDKAEADASGMQPIAAQHAAAFAFQVLAKLTSPLLGGASPPSEAAREDMIGGHKQVWNVPYQPNSFFTGREQILKQIAEALHRDNVAALSQPQAISGLGGVGKTQLAVEYAYQHREEYGTILWIRADDREALLSGYAEIARVLHLPQQDEQDQSLIVAAVLQWLKTHTVWLLILDNADELEIVHEFLPTPLYGHILLTTRAQATGGLARQVEVETMDADTGALLLLRRAGLIAQDALLEAASPSDVALAREITQDLGGLPLALDQAGAYIEEIPCSLSEYQALYHMHKTKLLKERRGLVSDHPESVTTTWSLSFQKVEQQQPAAADLLRFFAYLAPEAIPEEIIQRGAAHLGPLVQPLGEDLRAFHAALAVLEKYSLIHREPNQKTVSVHRLVQAVLQEQMDEQTRRQWAERVVQAVNATFPEVEHRVWPLCDHLLPHALLCATWIEQQQITLPAATHLLNQAGVYLYERARYQEAKALYARALSIREQQLGPEHLDVAESLNNLGVLSYVQGKYEQAESLYKRALSIREQQLGPEHLDTANSLNNLAALYEEQGKYERAESLYVRTQAIRERLLGPMHPLTASTLSNLACLYDTQGKYEQAESLYKRALSIREQQLGPEHPDTANSLNNLAALYKSLGRYEEAEPLYVRALSICEQQLGPEHPDTANRLNNLGVLYYVQGKYEQAEPLLARALSIREQQLGDAHPHTQVTWKHYISLLHIMGRDEETTRLEMKHPPSS